MTTDDHSPTAERSRIDARTWSPTRASTLLVVLGTLAVSLLLAGLLGASVGKGLVASALGAGCLAGAFWLLTWERWRVPATVAASLLFVPAGVGVTVGLGYVLLVEFAASFPAANSTRVVGQTLRILGVATVAGGVTASLFGALMAVRNVVTQATVEDGFDVLARTAALPVGFAVVFLLYALVTNFGPGLSGVDSLVARAVAAVRDWLFVTSPTPERPRLLAFWLLGFAAAYLVNRALGALPTAELAAGATVGDVSLDRLRRRVERGFDAAAAVGLLGVPVALFVAFVLPTGLLRATLPASLYGVLVAVTTASAIRHAFVWLAVAAAGALLVVRGIRKSARTDAETVLVGYAPFLGGLAIVATAFAVHRPVLRGLVAFVVGRLSSPLSGRFDRLAGSVVEFYGSHAVVLGLLAGVLVLTAAALLVLWLAFALGFVSDRVAGASIASGGLFVAVAFAGTVGAPLPVVLGGLVASLLVWDAGEFAATLGREVGRVAPTRRVELLHAAGTLAVGVLAAVTAGVLGTFAIPSAGIAAGSALAVALPGAIVSVLLLAIALR